MTDKKATPNVTPGWEEKLYTPERMRMHLNGEISGQELRAISGPQMLDFAVRGFTKFEQGKYDDAQVIFDGLCKLDSKEPYYQIALGAVYLAQDELDKAEACFDRAIALNTKEVAAHVNRGEVYLRQGRIVKAAEDFNRAMQLDPKGVDPLTPRAKMLATAALEMLETAGNAGTGKGSGGDRKPGSGGKAAPPAAKKPSGKKK